MQLPFYVKYGSDRYIVVSVVAEMPQQSSPDTIQLERNSGSWGVKAGHYSGGSGPHQVYKFIACKVEGSGYGSKTFIAIDASNCEFDGLVENCLMCGAPKAPGPIQS